MNPVVLHHGLFGGNYGIGKIRHIDFRGIDHAIIQRGYPLAISKVHPTAGIERRAVQLKQWIVENHPALGSKRIILVAHSLGGLDARYMLAKLHMADFVDTLLTISTPHRGSPYADYWVKHLGYRLGGLDLARRMKLDVQGVVDLTRESCARFNQEILDVPGVRYFSISAARPWSQVPAFALHAWNIVHKAEGANDSLVSVKSAAWGTHLATWPADHWHTINHRFVAEARRASGDIIPHYLAALDAIAATRKDSHAA